MPPHRPPFPCVPRATAAALATALSLAACNGSTGPGPEIHDTKYRAVDADGTVLDASVAPGVCVFDEFTGLTWETKSDQAGLQDVDNTYTWYDPAESHEGELDYRGLPGGGDCAGSGCDTAAYVDAVNALKLCGFDDWRMPTRDELGSISDPRKANAPPSINLRYFPHTADGEYWSGNDYQFQWDAAWVWSFHTSLDRVEWKKSPRYVRLVRGQPRQLTRVND